MNNQEGLEKAEITFFVDNPVTFPRPVDSVGSANGLPYVKFLPYVRVRTYDPATGYDGDEFYMPLKQFLPTQGPLQQGFRVCIENRSEGSFPVESRNVVSGVQQIHEFRDV